MSNPRCECGAEGQIKHREPGAYYCPDTSCPRGLIPDERPATAAEKLTAQNEALGDRCVVLMEELADERAEIDTLRAEVLHQDKLLAELRASVAAAEERASGYLAELQELRG